MDSLVPAATAARVARRIREELEALERVVSLAGEAVATWPEETDPPPLALHGAGGCLHDFYTGVEKVFTLVSPDLNGEAPAGDHWHRELLHAMALDVPPLRPAVISEDTERLLVAYLKFRHLYRNLYGFRLQWPRVRRLAEPLPALWEALRAEVEGFLGFLDLVVEQG